LRQRRKTVGLDQAERQKSDCEGPEQTIILNEQYTLLNDAMAELPHDQREIILLHLRNGMGFKQVAALLNISINTAKSRYRYGLAKLRTLLKCEVEP